MAKTKKFNIDEAQDRLNAFYYKILADEELTPEEEAEATELGEQVDSYYRDFDLFGYHP